jgi:hypothetical protein
MTHMSMTHQGLRLMHRLLYARARAHDDVLAPVPVERGLQPCEQDDLVQSQHEWLPAR